MLRKRREKKGLTQLQVANKIKKHRTYVSRLETHPQYCNPNVHTIIKLAIILEISGAEIFKYFETSKKLSEVMDNLHEEMKDQEN